MLMAISPAEIHFSPSSSIYSSPSSKESISVGESIPRYSLFRFFMKESEQNRTESSHPSLPSFSYERCGTPAYIAPEIYAKIGYDGGQCDIWSAGVTLYYILTEIALCHYGGSALFQHAFCHRNGRMIKHVAVEFFLAHQASPPLNRAAI